MAAPPTSPGEPITNKQQLVEDLARASTPREGWRIGTEHEKFGFRISDLAPMPYEGAWGIGALLEGLCRFGWEPVREGGNIIALKMDGCSITLEPGGQFELSGAPLKTLHETCGEVHTHLHQVKQVCRELGVGMLGAGFQPKWPRDSIHWMPKGRYEIMGPYMASKGNLGLDMMTRTCTVQTNLDFDSEADMVRKLRVGLALQPVATALFANSPFVEGKPSGFLSYRSHVWTDTDPDRCGILPFVFEDGMGFERWADYLLDVPMYFVYRDGAYINAAGQSFRDFMAGRLPALPGAIPHLGDWHDHMTTVFPEVRLKHYIEMRGADGGPWRSLCALPALWVGLLYDDEALDWCWDLIADWTNEEHEMLRAEVPRHALAMQFRGRPLRELAREIIDMARSGLERRAMLDGEGRSEAMYLDPLGQIAESGKTPAEVLLDLFAGRWRESVDPIFTEFAY